MKKQAKYTRESVIAMRARNIHYSPKWKVKSTPGISKRQFVPISLQYNTALKEASWSQFLHKYILDFPHIYVITLQ